MPSFLEMSDEDFLKAAPPEVIQEEVVNTEVVAETQPEPVIEDPVVEVPVTDPVDTAEEAPATEVDQPTTAEVTDPVIEPKTVETPAVEAPAETVNYEEGYKKLMAPLRANGKDIDIRSPEELIQLAQMGANYTKNMQQLAPHRKLLVMLEKAGINESNVGLLIDVHKKNPEAIAKMVKDSGVDPMEIDTSKEPQYVEGAHTVTDAEVAWRQSIEELQGSEEGRGTLVAVNQHWDNESKQLLADNPGLIQSIHAQRVSGTYDRIDAEIQRLRTLGNIPAGTSYLRAYQVVGDHLMKTGSLHPAQVEKPAAPAIKLPVATTVKKAEPAVKPGSNVGAATLSRTAPVVAKASKNFLAMSDDEFMKHFQNRL